LEKKAFYSSVDFMIIIQAVEGFWWRFRDESYHTRNSIPKTKNTFIGTILNELLAEFNDVFVLKKCEINIEAIVDSRHYYSHFLPLSKKPNKLEGWPLMKQAKYLLAYLESQGVIMQPDILVKEQFKPMENATIDYKVDNSTTINNNNQTVRQMSNQYNNRQVAYQPQPMNQNIVKQLNNQVYNQTRQMQQNTQYQNGQTINMHQFNNNIQPQIPNQFPNGQKQSEMFQ
jgi:hypothetical protein